MAWANSVIVPGNGAASDQADEPAELHHGWEYFRDIYDGNPDPWGFDRRWYEQRKFDLTVAALPRRRYRRALEPGCSNGALTERLAVRCDEVVAYDFVPEVVERARARLDGHHGVSVVSGEFPDHWPDGGGDLVIPSEVAYYLTPPGAGVAAAHLERWLEPGGDVVAVHYTGATDYPMTGAAVGTWLDSLPFLSRVVTHLDDGFELGVWTRAVGYGCHGVTTPFSG